MKVIIIDLVDFAVENIHGIPSERLFSRHIQCLTACYFSCVSILASLASQAVTASGSTAVWPRVILLAMTSIQLARLCVARKTLPTLAHALLAACVNT